MCRSFSREGKILLIFALIYIAIFIAFYPSFYRTPDEHQHLRNAFLFLSGSPKIEDPLYSYSYVFNGQEYVSFYPPMQSIFLIPFALGGWQSAFLLGLVLHLVNFFIFCKLLQKLKQPKIYALLFLFFLPFIYYSKQLFSELGSLTLIMLGYYLYLNSGRKSHFASGLLFGLALLSRYTNIIAIAALGAILLFRDRKKLTLVAAGVVPFLLIMLFYNQFMFGDFLKTGYQIAGSPTFSPENMPFRFLYSVLLLSLLYPLMFFSPLLAKNRLRREALLSTVFFIVFLGVYSWSYFKYDARDLVSGIGKLIPILFLLLLTYASAAERVIARLNLSQHRTKIIVATAILLLVPTAILQHEIKQKQDLRYYTFQKIYSQTKAGSLIVADEQFEQLPGVKESPFTGMFFMEAFGDRKLTTLKQPYQEHIAEIGEENTYYMKIWLDEGKVEVLIVPWKEFKES